MSKPEMDETKAKKFQERLERISRRRFMKYTAIGATAAAGLFIHRKISANSSNGDLSNLGLTQACLDTQLLLGSFTIRTLFTEPFIDLLAVGQKRFPTGTKATAISTVIQRIRSITDGTTLDLGKFYTHDREIDSTGTPIDPLRIALDNAEAHFIIPFRHMPDQVTRDLAVTLLEDRPLNQRATFLTAFGGRTLSYFFTEKLSSFDPWEQYLIRQAHRVGFLRAIPAGLAPQAANECAARSGDGVWSCQARTGDKCSLVEGQPTASSDLCPP